MKNALKHHSLLLAAKDDLVNRSLRFSEELKRHSQELSELNKNHSQELSELNKRHSQELKESNKLAMEFNERYHKLNEAKVIFFRSSHYSHNIY